MEPLFAVGERVTWSPQSAMATTYGSGTFKISASWVATITESSGATEKVFYHIRRVTRTLVHGLAASVDGVPFEEGHFILSD